METEHGMVINISGDASALRSEIDEVIKAAEKCCGTIASATKKAERLRTIMGYGAEPLTEERVREIVRDEFEKHTINLSMKPGFTLLSTTHDSGEASEEQHREQQ